MKQDYDKSNIKTETETQMCGKNSKKKRSIIDILAIQLAVALAIVAVAASVRYYLPEIYRDITSRFSGSVDFVSAFNAIGEGLSGESNFADALKDAYKYAFIGEDSKSVQVSALE